MLKLFFLNVETIFLILNNPLPFTLSGLDFTSFLFYFFVVGFGLLYTQLEHTSQWNTLLVKGFPPVILIKA